MLPDFVGKVFFPTFVTLGHGNLIQVQVGTTPFQGQQLLHRQRLLFLLWDVVCSLHGAPTRRILGQDLPLKVVCFSNVHAQILQSSIGLLTNLKY